ncbi:MAG: SigB/SigF/SigG family RNA polymerase sigma factor [Clostridiales bacterium]|nr:SigB/SigF/SigG family RNA polymerase sigma factor [Clostridiales bacterium]
MRKELPVTGPGAENEALLRRAGDGDPAARDELVIRNVGLVWSIVRRFEKRGYEPEDLFQIGCIGLIKAIDRFDMNFEVRFSTYAVPMITGEIRRFLRDDGMIRVSRSVREMAVRVSAARQKLTGSLLREPTLTEIAREVGVSCEAVTASMEAAADVESLDQPISGAGDQNLLLLDRLPDENDAQEGMLNRMLITQLMNALPDPEREIIVRRYFENQTQMRIAADLGISQVQVSRLEKRILRRMRELMGNE